MLSPSPLSLISGIKFGWWCAGVPSPPPPPLYSHHYDPPWPPHSQSIENMLATLSCNFDSRPTQEICMTAVSTGYLLMYELKLEYVISVLVCRSLVKSTFRAPDWRCHVSPSFGYYSCRALTESAAIQLTSQQPAVPAPLSYSQCRQGERTQLTVNLLYRLMER